ncbi:hypothetical protein IFM89_009066 [Coptis chinensis]|uniref:Transposase n=1 Tax=Coptis chinensis TaxID=261450 RepID=A0A835IM53_9MAGN|nr:hypothetical protein IFM89_009066 [Coptis chinensis]
MSNLQEEIDLPLIRKECTLRKLNTAWKQKKYELHKVYDMYPTDAERKRNGPKKVKKEEWEAFVDMCSTEEDKIKRCNGKLARENMKNPHTTGRMGAAPVIEQLKKDSPTGEVSRTQGYVATHTRRDGSFINTETRQSLEEINRLVSVEPDIVERDLDNDPVAMVIGRDGRGRVRGLGGGVTKTVYHASAPYKEIAQREKRARESSESGYEAVMARLDEADKARKILEDEVADLKRQSSGLGNASQEIQQSPVRGNSRDIRPQSTTCHLKSYITKTVVALGEVCTYLPTPPSSYKVRIDEILDDFAPLYEGDGRLGDIVLGDVIAWPKNYVVFH